MNDLQIFRFGHTPVCVVMIDGNPWFVGADVATALGYSNPRDALVKHVDDEDKTVLLKSQIATLGIADSDIPNRGLILINESGVYSLIFSSNLPAAKRFKRWVTHEVLPTVRKYGAYSMDELQRRKENRAALKPIRRELTDAIRDYVPESPHKRWAYKQYTDLSYKATFGMTAAQFRKQRGASKSANAADYMTADELAAVTRRQDQIARLLELGQDYPKIKDMLLASAASARAAIPAQSSTQSACPSA